MSLRIKFLITSLLCISFIMVLNMRIGQLPALGKLLDPFKGVWQNALISDIPSSKNLQLAGLEDSVHVVFNPRGVPHIFATNAYDLYFAAGYITAMHRLWQMEFTSHAALGRLSEVLGKRALELDQFSRRMGMVYGAEKILKEAKKDPGAYEALLAYSQGVNAWISSLEPRKYPLEYKLLDYAPEAWSPLKSASLGMSISRTLSGGSHAFSKTFMKAVWGKDVIHAFFPAHPQDLVPVIEDFSPDPAHPAPPPPPADEFIPNFIFEELLESLPEGVGSNNWAVCASKSLSGHALFATDPHLGLSLPSIWYEMQLNAPGINAYGVTFPGVPAIIMGFNEHIAWGNTNSGNLVLDILEIETDEKFQHYLHEGEWLPLSFRTETYKVRNSHSVTDTIAYTHHGPVMYKPGENPYRGLIPVNHALQWTATEPSNTISALKKINVAEDFNQFKRGLSQLASPPQCYAFASTNGDIAMQYNGLWPLRWSGQGRFIGDGRRADYNWSEYIPFEALPFEINPHRGFVSSANQHPTTSRYPYDYGWFFASRARASVINNKLDTLQQATPNHMKQLQLNASNYWAEQYLDIMVDSARYYLQHNKALPPDAFLYRVLDSLQNWNRKNEAHSIAATIFEKWRHEVRVLLWEPLLDPLKNQRAVRPPTEITFRVLFHHAPADVYQELFGQLPNTAQLLTASLEKVTEQLLADHGSWSENWQWWHFNGSTINHLLNISALNHPRLRVDGSSQSPNAISGNHGPSWRMVAEMSTPVKAWGIYPGGQAANPASRGYDAYIEDWAQGEYYPLHLFKDLQEARQNHKHVVLLKPSQNH